MIAKAFPLDRLLRKYIASAEEDSRSQGLC